MKRIKQASPPLKENNWLNLSLAEKKHISRNLKDVFFRTKTNRGWWDQDDPLFGKYNKKLTITTENKLFFVNTAKKHRVIEVLDCFEVTIDFNKPREVLDFARYFPSILFSTSHLLESKSFALAALRITPKLLPFLNDKLRDNESIIRAAITTFKSKNNSKLLRYASERLRDSKKFMNEIIQTCPGSFPFLSKKLRNDRELIDIYKSRNRFFTSVDELNGLPVIEKIKVLKTVKSGIRGISINWLKRQPKVVREDKELACMVMLRHSGYNPYLFPQFDKIKEHFKGIDFYKDIVKNYLLALFITFEDYLRQDENGYSENNRIYKSYAEMGDFNVPYQLKNKPHSKKVLDLIFNCLGNEGLVYSQKIDFTTAFLPQAFEFFYDFDINIDYEGNNTNGITIDFKKAMQEFYEFIREHEQISLFEKAFNDKEAIPSKEFNHTKTTQIIQDDNLRLDFWFDDKNGVSGIRASPEGIF